MILTATNHRGEVLGDIDGSSEVYNLKAKYYGVGGSSVSLMDSYVIVNSEATEEDIKFTAGFYKKLDEENLTLEEVRIKIIKVASIDMEEEVIKEWS